MSLQDHLNFSKKLDLLLVQRGLQFPDTGKDLYDAAVQKEMVIINKHLKVLRAHKEKILHPVLEVAEMSTS